MKIILWLLCRFLQNHLLLFSHFIVEFHFKPKQSQKRTFIRRLNILFFFVSVAYFHLFLKLLCGQINRIKLHHTFSLSLSLPYYFCVWCFYKFILLKNECTSFLPINTAWHRKVLHSENPYEVDYLNCYKQVFVEFLSFLFLCPFPSSHFSIKAKISV